MAADRRIIDWEAIEREYRAAQLSVSEIGRLHSISHTAINKRAKKERWARDLAARVREVVSARLVSPEVSETNAREAVETAAARVIELVRQHRRDIGEARSLVAALVLELKESSEARDEIERSIEIDTPSPADHKRRAAMLRAVSLSGRSATILNLANASRGLLGLERQAFNLSEGDGGGQDGPAPKHEIVMRIVRASNGPDSSQR